MNLHRSGFWSFRVRPLDLHPGKTPNPRFGTWVVLPRVLVVAGLRVSRSGVRDSTLRRRPGSKPARLVPETPYPKSLGFEDLGLRAPSLKR